MEHSLLDLAPEQAHILELLAAISEQAGGRTRQLMQDGQALSAWTDLPDPAALEGIEAADLDQTIEWYRGCQLPGLLKDIYMYGALEQAGVSQEAARAWLEKALGVWNLTFLDFPFPIFWQACDSRLAPDDDENSWLTGILKTLLDVQDEAYGRLRQIPQSAYVLVIAADYDPATGRYFADVEAGLSLSRTALRQLSFLCTQFCESRKLEPMDEDGSVFVLGLKQSGDRLIPEVQAQADLSELVGEIIRLVKAE